MAELESSESLNFGGVSRVKNPRRSRYWEHWSLRMGKYNTCAYFSSNIRIKMTNLLPTTWIGWGHLTREESTLRYDRCVQGREASGCIMGPTSSRGGLINRWVDGLVEQMYKYTREWDTGLESRSRFSSDFTLLVSCHGVVLRHSQLGLVPLYLSRIIMIVNSL